MTESEVNIQECYGFSQSDLGTFANITDFSLGYIESPPQDPKIVPPDFYLEVF